MARLSIDDRVWTEPDQHDWLKTVGLEDCASILKAHNLSAEDFQGLKEYEVMTWTELPLVRRRQLVELMHRMKTKSGNSKTFTDRSSQSNVTKEARIKRLFGTLTSGLKKRTPLPLPTDYSNQSSAQLSQPGLQPLQQETHESRSSDKEQNDWGSEFSDSEEEESGPPIGNFQVRGSPVFSKKPLGATRSISASAITIESQVPHIAESVSFARRPDRENVYEVPQDCKFTLAEIS
ncbi:hypothetical protein RvY_01625-2 [Ramazzottius varieornatus]|uniref:SAM domain-containing protein n=1 Tax=Ramazzottius varieornatus TaxID=947166 RepID=A0A1D1UH16_RAMVA|nr:hypothetical protein RvY_01625-2 [Ramazzottius varieornatus]